MTGHGEGLLEAIDRWAKDSFETASPLPGWMYTSPDIARLEHERVFRRGWICVGRGDEIENPGDYLATVVAEQPVVVLRTAGGAVRAMSNVCAHRGMLLAEGQGNTTTFRCGYHSWVYDETGALRSAPHMERSPNFEKASICLPDYRVELWHGYMFVNLDPGAAPLAPLLRELDPIYDALGIRSMRVALRTETTYACNWKVLCENFCESYHVGTVHRTTLEPDTPTRTTRAIPGGEGFNLHTMTFRKATTAEAGDPAIEDRGWLSCIYPSFVVSVQSSSALCLLLRPSGTEKVHCTALVAVPAADGQPAELDADHLERVRAFMSEDETTIERLQQGLHAFEPTPGAYCHMERTNWELGQYLHRSLRS